MQFVRLVVFYSFERQFFQDAETSNFISYVD